MNQSINYIDLHVHTNYSDGSMSPAEIAGAAATLGLRYLAITDHDTIGGVGDALAAAARISGRELEHAQTQAITASADPAKRLEKREHEQAQAVTASADPAKRLEKREHEQAQAVTASTDPAKRLEKLESAYDSGPAPLILIPGVEISADYSCALHILGYFRADNYTQINGFLNEMRYERYARNLSVIEKLKGLGIRITEGEVAEIAGKKVFGRPHIAAALIRKGIVPNQAAAFNEYLSGGRKAYVKKRSRPPEECVAAIAEAGGLPVIAHPGQTGLKLSEIYTLAQALLEYGLFGIEAYYPEHTEKAVENYAELAASLKLLATGGSDFHGAYRPHIRLGGGKDGNLRVPGGVADAILSALHKM